MGSCVPTTSGLGPFQLRLRPVTGLAGTLFLPALGRAPPRVGSRVPTPNDGRGNAQLTQHTLGQALSGTLKNDWGDCPHFADEMGPKMGSHSPVYAWLVSGGPMVESGWPGPGLLATSCRFWLPSTRGSHTHQAADVCRTSALPCGRQVTAVA